NAPRKKKEAMLSQNGSKKEAMRKHCGRNPNPNPKEEANASSSRARARESGESLVLKKESEARKEKRARVQADTPQWDAWQPHLKASKGKGSPCDKQFGWYFPTEWPPGYQPAPDGKSHETD